MARSKLILSVIGLALCLGMNALYAQGTAFTYQGRLNDGSGPASGSYDFRFQLAPDSLGSNVVGNPISTNALSVRDGFFAVTLDFGAGVFLGSNYWLQLEVKTNGADAYILSVAPTVPDTLAVRYHGRQRE